MKQPCSLCALIQELYPNGLATSTSDLLLIQKHFEIDHKVSMELRPIPA